MLIETGKVRMTASAVAGGEQLGLDRSAIVAIVMALAPKDFYKSMTAHADHRIWQDVYRPTTPVGDVYLKLSVLEDVLIPTVRQISDEPKPSQKFWPIQTNHTEGYRRKFTFELICRTPPFGMIAA